MTLRDHALRVLWGDTLADKLATWDAAVEPVAGAPGGVPAEPGRPAALALHRGHGEAPPRGLGSDRDRVRVLHAFVSHELQALELLALAIVRFPDAEPRLHRAWAATLADEQRHLAAYLDRLAALGGELGAEPVGAFFWDALRGAPDPVRFTVGLGLVLEQANLDFALRWRRAFLAAGDLDTASVLDQVYQDEIRHVRVAARVLRADQRPDETLFATFERNLFPPLSAARARGARPPDVDRDGRRRAGLYEAFIDEVAVAGASKGPDPRVFVLDPYVEDDLAGRPAPADGGLAADLAPLPLVMARAGDVVVADRPSTEVLGALAAAGFPIPQFVPRPDPVLWLNGRAAHVWTWGTSARVAERLSALGVVHDPRVEPLFDKAWVAERAPGWLDAAEVGYLPEELPVVCETRSDVDRAVAQLGDGVIKAAIATAGRHRAWFTGGALDPRRSGVVEDALARGRVVVERRQDVVAELSVLADVGDRGVHVRGVHRFGATGGTYRGSVVGPPALGCSHALARFLHGEGGGRPAIPAALERVARVVGGAASALGLTGPFDIDARIVRRPTGYGLVALGDLNPRPTMGHLALALRDRVVHRSAGLWLFLPIRSLGDPAAFATSAVAAHPVVTEGGRIAAGVVATTDPAQVARVWTVLVVGRGFAEAAETARGLVSLAARPEVLAAQLGWLEVG